MANVIKLKRGTTDPLVGDLTQGELAINTLAGTLWTKKDDNTIIQLDGSAGGLPDAASDGVTYGRRDAAWAEVIDTLGGQTITNTLDIAGSSALLVLQDTNSAASTYTQIILKNNAGTTMSRLGFGTSDNLLFENTVVGGNLDLNTNTGVVQANGNEVITTVGGQTIYNGTGSNQLYLQSPDTGQSALTFGGVTTPNGGRITYSDNSDWLRFYLTDAATTRFEINTAGALVWDGSAMSSVLHTGGDQIKLGDLSLGDGTTSENLFVYYNDGAYAQITGYGMQLSRATSYIRPINDGTQTLHIGGSTGTQDWDHIHFAVNNDFQVNGNNILHSGGGQAINMPAGGSIFSLVTDSQDIDFRIGDIASNAYGFFWRYKGVDTGNDNDLEFWAENQLDTNIQVSNIKQNGVTDYLVAPTINSNKILTEADRNFDPVVTASNLGSGTTGYWFKICTVVTSLAGDYMNLILDISSSSYSSYGRIQAMFRGNAAASAAGVQVKVLHAGEHDRRFFTDGDFKIVQDSLTLDTFELWMQVGENYGNQLRVYEVHKRGHDAVSVTYETASTAQLAEPTGTQTNFYAYKGLMMTDAEIEIGEGYTNAYMKANNLYFEDNKYLRLGTGGDIQMFHTGTNTIFQNVTGAWYLDQRVDSGTLYLRSDNSVGTTKTGIAIGGGTPFVKLYYDGVQKLQTADAGVFVSGKIKLIDAGNEYIYSDGSVRIDIDNNNDQTDRVFIVSKHNAATTLLTLNETGNMWIGDGATVDSVALNLTNGEGSSYISTNGGYTRLGAGGVQTYAATANDTYLYIAGTARINLHNTAFAPHVDSDISLGSDLKRWSNFFTDAATVGGDLIVDGYFNATGKTHAFADTGVVYQHKFDNGTNLSWLKLADITVGTGLYVGGSWRVEVTHTGDNWGLGYRSPIHTYDVHVGRSAGVQDNMDTGWVKGRDGSNIALRLRKVSIGVYEVHVKCSIAYRELVIRSTHMAVGGATAITYNNLLNTEPAAGTSGVLYYPNDGLHTMTNYFDEIEASTGVIEGNLTATTFIGALTGKASQVTVSDHTANDTEYPVVWHNNSNTLYDSSNGMKYNPAQVRLSVPTIEVIGANDLALTSRSGNFRVGAYDGQHIGLDNNEIMSKTNGTTAGTLLIHNQGGAVSFGQTNELTSFLVNAASATLNGDDIITSASTVFAKYSATGVLSNALASSAWVTDYNTGTNVDHVWHDDSANRWHFCSDVAFKSTGNSSVQAGTFIGALTGTASNAALLDSIDSTGFARVGTTSPPGNYLYSWRDSANTAFFVRQASTGPIARFFQSATAAATSGTSQVEITNSGGIVATGSITSGGTAVSLSGHTHSYDNYNGWDLLVNGAGTNRVTTGENVNFVEGTGIDIAQSGTTVTISSTTSGNASTTYFDDDAGAGAQLGYQKYDSGFLMKWMRVYSTLDADQDFIWTTLATSIGATDLAFTVCYGAWTGGMTGAAGHAIGVDGYTTTTVTIDRNDSHGDGFIHIFAIGRWKA